MGVTMWCPGHFSSCAYPRVLLQHAHHLVPLFFTCVRGTCIPITPQLVADVLRVPRVEFPDYPSCERLQTMSKDELNQIFVSVLSSGVSASSLTVRPLQKAHGFWTWWWPLYSILSLTITLSLSLVFDFYCLFLSILLLISLFILFFPS